MKKYITIILVAGILVLAFFLSKNKTPSEEIIVDETPVVEAPTETTPTDKPEVVTEKKYSYTNSEFNFALDLPGLVATRRTDVPSYVSAIFTFGVGDQSNVEEQERIPNTMVVYIWSDRTEFENMVGTGTKLPSETVKGVKFDVYTFENEGNVIYRYTTTRNGTLYDIGVSDKAKMQKFTFL